MKAPEKVPESVLAGVERYRRQHAMVAVTLHWDSVNGCYYFLRDGVYHGVELTGQVHT